MKLFKMLFIGLLILSHAGCKSSFCEPNAGNKSCDLPKRIGYVNDYCNFLTAEERKKLDETIADFHAKTGKEIVIVVEDSRKPHSRKFHTPQCIAQKWQLGKPDKFNGILITVSRKRKWVDFLYGAEINTKYSPEDRRVLLREKILPSFYKKKYYEGLSLGLAYIISHE